MKQIQPTQTTTNGPLCTHIKVWSTNDDFKKRADFEWILFDSIGQIVNNGLIPCEEDDYNNWTGDNKYPYTFVTNILNLTLI